VSLAESLERGGIFYRVNGFDVESALRAVVDIVRLPDEVDREFLVKVLLARELLEPTAVGEGIAIPHVRNPIVLHVQRPTLVLCFLEQAIDYGALDGVPVRVLFMLVSPTLRAHLRLLARLSYALRDPDFKQVVLGEGSRPEIVREARRVETSMASGRSPLPVETA
jgi:PTS system nitrogen regulatory IIA component